MVAQMIKNPRAMQEPGFDLCVGKIPWRREGLPTPVFLPEEFHEQRSLAGCSPWGCKGLDTIEWLKNNKWVRGLFQLFLGKGQKFPGIGPPLKFWPFMISLRTVMALVSVSICVCLFAQSCPTLCYPRYYNLPGSSVHGILQARILEWVAIAFSKGSSQHRDQTWVSCISGSFFIIRATREGLF